MFRVLFRHRRVEVFHAPLFGAVLMPPHAALMPGLNDWLAVFWSYYSWLLAGAGWLLALRSTTRTAGWR
jgi:hypothetical protein